ncbi:Putative disease resistance protein RGA3 [Morus notabilis]|uniref:Putative disease resistance protein RGA3 n=1 Tax=Morus notabilis TaxID=981085 RepID=W9R4Q4_9ROSA|nr:putative disease resistance protein RGA3 [Morus notabilis]EXB68161.1 Putative disease resistance protein RGA3 [Morus notabilis]
MSENIASVANRIFERLCLDLFDFLDPAAWPDHPRVDYHELQRLHEKISTIKSAFDHKKKNMQTCFSYIHGLNSSELEGSMHDLEDKVDEMFSESFRRRKLIKVCKIHSTGSSQKQRPTLSLPNYFWSNFEEAIHDITELISSCVESSALSLIETFEIIEIAFRQEDGPCVPVVPIISKLGAVKTALALFIHGGAARREPGFDTLIRVCVYELFNMRVQVRVQEVAELNSWESAVPTDDLEGFLQEATKGKTFVLVLHDLRSVEDETYWRCLKRLAARVGKGGSKIFIVTSNEEAAENMGTKPPFFLDSSSGFDEEQFIITVCRETRTPEHVLSKWLGSVLTGNDDRAWKVTVINTIVDILQFNYTKNFWQSWISKGSTLNDDDRLDEIEIDRSLFQRYVELPSYLKQCFEYCRLFPKDCEIDVHTLIHLWMAQGFITLLDDDSQSLEDVGHMYFVVLLEKGFFQKVDQSDDHILDRAVTRCKMDGSGYNLLIIIGGMRYVVLHSGDGDYDLDHFPTTHHVSFNFHLHSPRQIPRSMKDDPEMIRSILLPRQSLLKYEEGMIDPEKILHIAATQSSKDSLHWRPGLVTDAIISKFRWLRALDLHDLGIKVVPHFIEELMHLRYLDLSKNAYMKALPASVTKLEYLQTLKLSDCIGLEELPKDIKNLVNLRSLEIDGCYNLTHMPRGLGELTNLHVLPQFVLNKEMKDSSSAYGNSGGLNELEKLNNLRGELQIKNLTTSKDAKAAYLGAKQDLQVLSLDWDVGETGPFPPEVYESQLEDLKPHLDLKGLTLHGYGGTMFPTWLNVPQRNLVKLLLRKCWGCKYLPPFGQLVKLKVLILDEISNLEYIEDESKTYFPALQELSLTEMPKLRGWRKTESVSLGNQKYLPSFPCLSKLVIENCPQLDSMPLFPTLEEGLVLESTCLSPLHLTKKPELASSSTTSPPLALSKLKNLSIASIDKFDGSKAGEIAWDSLKSLQTLKLNSLPELTTLPEGLQQVTTLQELHVGHCGLKKIPAWIGKLKFLEKLVIRTCPMLETLPAEIRSLESSKRLEIDDCPNLYRSRLAYD